MMSGGPSAHKVWSHGGWHGQSSVGTDAQATTRHKTIVNKGDCRGLAPHVTMGQDDEIGSGGRARTCRNTLETKGNCGADSSVDSFFARLPADLREVIASWDNLGEPLRVAVLAIVRMSQAARPERPKPKRSDKAAV